MRICPNDKFIEIFALRFHYLEDPFHKFFALNLIFQNTSYSLVLKYSSFSFYNLLISGSKSVKFAQKFRIFLKFPTLEGHTAPQSHPPSHTSPLPTHLSLPPPHTPIPLPTAPLTSP